MSSATQSNYGNALGTRLSEPISVSNSGLQSHNSTHQLEISVPPATLTTELPVSVTSLASEVSSLHSDSPTIPSPFSQFSNLGTSFSHTEQVTDIDEIDSDTENDLFRPESPYSQPPSSSIPFSLPPFSPPRNMDNAIPETQNTIPPISDTPICSFIHFHGKTLGSGLGRRWKCNYCKIPFASMI